MATDIVINLVFGGTGAVVFYWIGYDKGRTDTSKKRAKNKKGSGGYGKTGGRNN